MSDAKKPVAAAAAGAAARTPTPFETHAESLHSAISFAADMAKAKGAAEPTELTYQAAAEYASKACRRRQRPSPTPTTPAISW